MVLTCEHAFNKIPKEYKHLFLDAEEIQESHRGFDPGAFDLYKKLEALADFCFYHKTGRLLAEVNRSKSHPHLFSEFTKELSKQEKAKILDNYYFPYRYAIEKAISAFLEKDEKVLHFSVHTFTPKLNGVIRNTDIGLLYDPANPGEKEFSKKIRDYLKMQNPDLKIRFNYPYRGKADGFTTYLRKKFPKNYLGIEIEVNQKLVNKDGMDKNIKSIIFSAVERSL